MCIFLETLTDYSKRSTNITNDLTIVKVKIQVQLDENYLRAYVRLEEIREARY